MATERRLRAFPRATRHVGQSRRHVLRRACSAPTALASQARRRFDEALRFSTELNDTLSASVILGQLGGDDRRLVARLSRTFMLLVVVGAFDASTTARCQGLGLCPQDISGGLRSRRFAPVGAPPGWRSGPVAGSTETRMGGHRTAADTLEDRGLSDRTGRKSRHPDGSYLKGSAPSS